MGIYKYVYVYICRERCKLLFFPDSTRFTAQLLCSELDHLAEPHEVQELEARVEDVDHREQPEWVVASLWPTEEYTLDGGIDPPDQSGKEERCDQEQPVNCDELIGPHTLWRPSEHPV